MERVCQSWQALSAIMAVIFARTIKILKEKA